MCVLLTRDVTSLCDQLLRTLTTWQWHYTVVLLCAVQQSIDISCQQECLLLCPMLGQTDRRTDTLPFHRPCSVSAANWRPQYCKEVNGSINFRTEYGIKVPELFTLCVSCIATVIFTKRFTLTWAHRGLAPDKLRPCSDR